MRFSGLIFLLLSFSSLLTFGSTQAVWIMSEKAISFYSPDKGIQVLEGISAKKSLVDPETCNLWVQSQNRLLQISPNLEIQKEISTPDSLLGAEVLDGIFFSTSHESWTLRDKAGESVRIFPSLISSPETLQGNLKSGFWSLQFLREKNVLEIIHFDSEGQMLWKRPVSTKVELWSDPKLNLLTKQDQLWISYTASSNSHAYSPVVELWTPRGDKLKTFSYSDRGLLLDACTTDDEAFLISRDIPSSPYTIPLFSFLELLTPDTKPKTLYQASDNYLINSLQCRSNVIWALQKSVLGGQNTLLVELSAKMEEKRVLPLKEPAWKIHACSLQ